MIPTNRNSTRAFFSFFLPVCRFHLVSFLDTIHLIRSRDHTQTSAAHAPEVCYFFAALYWDTGAARRFLVSSLVLRFLGCRLWEISKRAFGLLLFGFPSLIFWRISTLILRFSLLSLALGIGIGKGSGHSLAARSAGFKGLATAKHGGWDFALFFWHKGFFCTSDSDGTTQNPRIAASSLLLCTTLREAWPR